MLYDNQIMNKINHNIIFIFRVNDLDNAAHKLVRCNMQFGIQSPKFDIMLSFIFFISIVIAISSIYADHIDF